MQELLNRNSSSLGLFAARYRLIHIRSHQHRRLLLPRLASSIRRDLPGSATAATRDESKVHDGCRLWKTPLNATEANSGGGTVLTQRFLHRLGC
jgi:hypothetical protein